MKMCQFKQISMNIVNVSLPMQIAPSVGRNYNYNFSQRDNYNPTLKPRNFESSVSDMLRGIVCNISQTLAFKLRVN